MAEIDRVCTVEATGITLTIDSGTFSHNKSALPQAAAPFSHNKSTLPQAAAPFLSQRHLHTGSGTLIQQAIPSYSRWQHRYSRRYPHTAGGSTLSTFNSKRNGTLPSRNRTATKTLHKTGLHFTLQQTRAEAAPSRRLHAKIKSQWNVK